MASTAELRSEDQGWIPLSDAAAEKDLPALDYKRMHHRSFEAWKSNPLARLWVNLTTWFVVDEGLTFECPNDPTGEVKTAMESFYSDNDVSELEHRLCDHLQVFGEAFVGIFVSRNRHDEGGRVTAAGDGSVQLIDIDPLQIIQVIQDTDTGEPLYYRRRYASRRWSADLSDHEDQEIEELVPDYRNAGAGPGSAEVRDDMAIFHVKRNAIAGMTRGVSDLYPALDWLRAYKVWLEDRLRINKAKGMYVWKKKVYGGAQPLQVQAGAAAEGSSKPGHWSRNPRPPAAGSVVVENQNVSWEMISNSVDAGDAAEDGRAIKLMICAAAAMGEHFFSDAKVGNLASTKSMELPAKKKFQSFRMTLTRVFNKLFALAAEAIRDNTTRFDHLPPEALTVRVHYPPLVKLEAEDMQRWMEAVEKQINLGLISRRNVMEQLPQVKDVEEERRWIAEEAQQAGEAAPDPQGR